MLRKLRIAVLLYVLAFVAVGQYLTTRSSRAWDAPLWVDVYPVHGDTSAAVERYVAALDEPDFEAVEAFFAAEAESASLAIGRPFRFDVAPPLAEPPPALPRAPGVLGVLGWSLRMRWFTTRLVWSSDRPRPDIVLYAVYHGAEPARVLDDSGALEKGMIVVANLFANSAAEATNHVVIAHELLHTVGATDKYDPRTGMPVHPVGFAAPAARPRFPQQRAELMAGRIPLAAERARMPASLREVVVGPATAAEIGWTARTD